MTDEKTDGTTIEDQESPTRSPQDVTILVVDDEPDVLFYLTSVLEDAGMNVITANDGEGALEILEQQTPDMISLDLVMPRKSGIRVIHELRRRTEWSRIPLVIVTGHAQDRDVRRDLDQVMASSVMSGSSMYLEKPVTPQRYLQHICSVLGLDHPANGSAEQKRDELKRQAEDLLANADADTLAEVLQALQKKG